jgi:hypothetical protein
MKILNAALTAAAIAFSVVAGARAGDAANNYAKLKTFAGLWEGTVTTDPKGAMEATKFAVRIRVTSSGHAIVHEMGGAATGQGPEHMGDVTVFYLENEDVLATHFCDADTRSHLKAAPPSDTHTVVFDFAGVTGNTKFGYVQDITFKSDTPDHHIELLTFVMPDKRVVHATMDLHKVNP